MHLPSICPRHPETLQPSPRRETLRRCCINASLEGLVRSHSALSSPEPHSAFFCVTSSANAGAMPVNVPHRAGCFLGPGQAVELHACVRQTTCSRCRRNHQTTCSRCRRNHQMICRPPPAASREGPISRTTSGRKARPPAPRLLPPPPFGLQDGSVGVQSGTGL